MKRNSFFSIIVLVTILLVTQSCNKDKVQRIDFSVDLNDPANYDLTDIGGCKVFNSSVIVAKDVNNNYIALSAICTYDQCLVEFQTTNEFVCPCCQSHFDTGGNPTFGSATSPLPVYQVQQINNILHIYTN